MITKIFHISDLHVMERNYKNINSSIKKLVDDIKVHGVNESLLCIVGDIFEFKSSLHTDDIFCWKSICFLLQRSNIKTLVIPGNHDYNINSELVRDNVSLLTSDYSNIVCINKTGVYRGIFDDPRLEFHIFSPIDKLMPDFTPANPAMIKIALLHEPVNQAKYDNGESISNGRFTAGNLSKYDYALLGDIHLHQYLTPRIAYCGSFVQKTKGEGISKGYILWDLNSGTSSFHPIMLREIYIKIMAEDDVCVMPIIDKQQVVRHTSLIYKNCTLSFIQRTKETLTNKYGYINRVVDNTKYDAEDEEIKITDNTQGKQQFNHEEIITNMLKDYKHLDKILLHHAHCLKDRNEANYTTYKLNYLVWSNIFCYGEHNYINFNEFKNDLVMLSGKNKEGKSSIIDIIIRVLFNECERGFKDDIVNKSKSQGYIKISFNIAHDEYTIEHLYNTKTRAQHHRLFKNGRNITQDTIVNTYLYLRNKIGLGDYKDFVNMTTALQNRKFLVDMPQKDFISLLTKITNVDVLKDIEDSTKKSINELKAFKKKYEADLNTMPVITQEMITILEDQRDVVTKQRDVLFVDMEQITSKLITINKDYDNTPISDNLESHIHQLETTLSNTDTVKYTTLSISLDDISKRIWLIQKRVESVNKDKMAQILTTDYIIVKSLNKTAITKQIKDLTDTTYKPGNATLRDITLLQDIIDNPVIDKVQPLEHNGIVTLKSLISSDEDKDLMQSGLPDYDQINNEILDLDHRIQAYNKNFGALTFNSDCTSCSTNKTSIDNIFDINHELGKLGNLKSTYAQKTIIEGKYAKAKAYQDAKDHNDICNKNLNIISTNNLVTLRINTYNTAAAEMKDAINKKNWDTLQTLEKHLNLINCSDIKNLELERVELTRIKKYIDTKNTLANLLKLRDIKLKNGSRLAEMTRLEEFNKVIKSNLEIYNTKISRISEEYRINSNLYEKREALIKDLHDTHSNLEFYEKYYGIINCKTGIPSYILKNTCEMVQKNCNKILQKITDFTIYIHYDKEIKIYTVENDIKIPATMGSGMMKFLLDLIFRITLTEISSISCPRTLFVDEGFGALDRENFIAVANILQKLKANFDSLIIISHITELQSYVDKTIEIKRSGYLSNVQYGSLNTDERLLRLMTDTESHAQHIAEFKGSKPAKKQKKEEEATVNEQRIVEYCSANGGLEDVLIDMQETIVHCRGCCKDFNIRSGFAGRHIVSATHKKKHDAYILSLM